MRREEIFTVCTPLGVREKPKTSCKPVPSVNLPRRVATGNIHFEQHRHNHYINERRCERLPRVLRAPRYTARANAPFLLGTGRFPCEMSTFLRCWTALGISAAAVLLNPKINPCRVALPRYESA